MSETYQRPSWDEYFLEVMHALAKRATCDRGRTACVIVKDNQILSKDSFDFLLEQKQEAMKEILLYYSTFFPESKNKEIELIKNGNINDDNLDDYIPAKKFNLRKPLIFSLINENNELNPDDIRIFKSLLNQSEE